MKISIVTPCFNSGQYIKQTIDSIKAQTYKNYEHIVIDGQSNDNTIDVLKSYPNLKWISEPDKGQTDALNKGFKMASGDILAWQNADDVYFENTFQTVIDFFSRNPNTDIVYGYYQLIDENDNWICNVKPMQWSTWWFKHGRFVPLQPTVFWRRKVYEEVGDLNQNLHYCMDVDFFSKAAKKFSFSLIPDYLGKFRVHLNSKTQNNENSQKVKAEYFQVLKENFNFKPLNTLLFKILQFREQISSKIKKNGLFGSN